MISGRAQAVLVGGAFNGVLSALPLIELGNCACCLWVVGGGVITAYLLQQGQAERLEMGDGALGGFLAGVAGAAICALLTVPIRLAAGSLADQAFPLDDLDAPPEVIEMVEFFQQASESVALMALLTFVFMLIAGAVFSTVGGMLGVLFFRKDPPPGGPYAAPPPGGGDIVPPPPTV